MFKIKNGKLFSDDEIYVDSPSVLYNSISGDISKIGSRNSIIKLYDTWRAMDKLGLITDGLKIVTLPTAYSPEESCQCLNDLLSGMMPIASLLNSLNEKAET